MRKYNLTGTQNFYGIRDVKTYYNVPANKVWDALNYMSQTFNLPTIFVYLNDNKVGKNTYIGSYSKKYNNFTDVNRQRHKTFNF